MRAVGAKGAVGWGGLKIREIDRGDDRYFFLTRVMHFW